MMLNDNITQFAVCEFQKRGDDPCELQKENSSDIDASCNICVDVSPAHVLAGTYFSNFLSSFLTRTTKFCKPLVDYTLIQKGVQLILVGSANNSLQVKEKAAKTYVFSVIAIGSLQANFLYWRARKKHYKVLSKALKSSCGWDWEARKNYYEMMKHSLKSCFGEEENEVIFAHLAISYFCLLTRQTHEYIKHSGFARALLEVSDCPSDQTVQCFSYVVVGPQLLAANVFGKKTLLFCLRSFSITEGEFQTRFPHFFGFFSTEKEDLLAANSEAIALANDLMSSDKSIAITGMVWSFPTYIRSLLVDTFLSGSEKLQAFQQLREYAGLVEKSVDCLIKNTSLSNQAVMIFVDVFQCLCELAYFQARQKIAELVEMIDCYMICSWKNTESEHLLHFCLILLCWFEMKEAYGKFQSKMNTVYYLLQSEVNMSKTVPLVADCLTNICQDSKCLAFKDLSSLSSTPALSTPPLEESPIQTFFSLV